MHEKIDFMIQTSKFREFMSPAIIVYFNQRTFQWNKNKLSIELYLGNKW